MKRGMSQIPTAFFHRFLWLRVLQRDQSQQQQFDQTNAHPAAGMVEEMEAAGGGIGSLQAERLHLHDWSSPSGPDAKGVVASGSSAADGGAAESPDLQPPTLPSLRQCDGAVRAMHSVPPQVEVGRHERNMVRCPWIAKLLHTVATIATSVLDINHAQVQAESPTTTPTGFGPSGGRYDLRSSSLSGTSQPHVTDVQLGGSKHDTFYDRGRELGGAGGDQRQPGLLLAGASGRD